MTQHLLIIGAGYTGLRIARLAIEQGYAVTATTRDAERISELGELGAETLRWSIGDDPSVLPDADAVIYSVPPTDEPAPLRVLAEGRRFVYLSSTSVYGDYDEQVVTEDSERRPTSPVGMARKAIEDELLSVGGDVCIVRIVGIYGPGRTLDRYLAGGRYKLVDGGQKLTNRIHVDDLARIVLAVVRRGTAGEAYIAADGSPVRVHELVDWLVEHLGIERPPEVSLEQYRAERGDNAAERWANSYIASNRKIIEELGVELQYRNAFEGYAAILR